MSDKMPDEVYIGQFEEGDFWVKDPSKWIDASQLGWSGKKYIRADLVTRATPCAESRPTQPQAVGEIPMVYRPARNKTIPDLTKREHVCEFQSQIVAHNTTPCAGDVGEVLGEVHAAILKLIDHREAMPVSNFTPDEFRLWMNEKGQLLEKVWTAAVRKRTKDAVRAALTAQSVNGMVLEALKRMIDAGNEAEKLFAARYMAREAIAAAEKAQGEGGKG